MGTETADRLCHQAGHLFSRMRVFLSSSFSDLIDVRSEISALLTGMGAVPMLSDDRLSDFQVHPDANTIETCLINVRSADFFVLVMDRRYGPLLGSNGYENVSATELEWREAQKAGKPIYAFARDRLLADHKTWRNLGCPENTDGLSWVDGRTAELLRFVEAVMELSSPKTVSNWLEPFRCSVDLKMMLQKKLGKKLLSKTLQQAVEENRFPIFHLNIDAEWLPIGKVQMVLRLENVSNGPAFDVEIYRDGKYRSINSLVTGRTPLELTELVAVNARYNGTLSLRYKSSLGIRVEQQFEVGISLQSLRQADCVCITKCVPGERDYFEDEPVTFRVHPLPGK